MITEDYVSFEAAKLLKEKGFPQETRICNQAYKSNGIFCNNPKSTGRIHQDTYFFAPTLQMAMKWLRKVHNLHIGIVRGPNGYHISIETIPLGVVKYITREIVGNTYIDSYEAACEAAIKYCLENLI